MTSAGLIPDSRDWREHYCYYFDAVRSSGGEPVPLTPENTDPAAFDLGQIDGLLLAGGGDIDPARYGQAMDGSETAGMSAARDELELTLARRAVERDMPVLGVCRGIQTLNVALGGGLVQDVPNHRLRGPDGGGWIQHWIDVPLGTRLAAVLGTSGRVVVNSHHHQVVTTDNLAPGLVASGVDLPGGWIVEALEHPARRWVIAVQWHPEREWEVPEAQHQLFEAFVEAARNGD